ncbi:MAG TPA: hypothetical protein PKG71_02350 [Candidatus Woesebacteria bacterium]|nr:hypothetical protein [Candidatus Woesebacteria bacterium]HNS94786.1 hypothetical protein [Candidatus Woesebacteria bacterium]
MTESENPPAPAFDAADARNAFMAGVAELPPPATTPAEQAPGPMSPPDVQPGLVSGQSGGFDGNQRPDAQPRSESRERPPASPEQRRQALYAIIKSLGKDAFRNDRGPESVPLSVIGLLCEDGVLEEPSVGIHLKDDPESPWFGPNHPLPRVRALADGSYALAYDKRSERMPNTPSGLPPGVIELKTFRGKTQGPKGPNDLPLVHFSGTDSAGNPVLDIALPMQQATELLVLTQYADLKASSNENTNPALKEAVNACERYVSSITPTKPYGNENLDITDGIADKVLREALEVTAVSAVTADTFAQNMLDYIRSDQWGGSPKEMEKFEQDISAIRQALESGLQPTGAQLQEVLRMAALPGLQRKAGDLELRIAEQRKAGKDTTELENSLKSLRSFQSGETDSLYRRYLDAVVAGDVDMADAQWFTNQMLEAKDPWAFLKEHDWQDDKCLAGKAFKHIMGGLNPEQTARAQAWLTKFLQEHGQDIALMGIFALFQMMSGIIGDAARKA